MKLTGSDGLDFSFIDFNDVCTQQPNDMYKKWNFTVQTEVQKPLV